MTWEAPQGDAVPLGKMVKPAYHWIRLSQALCSSAVLSHRVSSDTTSCSSPAIRPEVFSFHAFPFCVGNQRLRKGKVYRWGNLSPFFLRRGTLERAATSDTGGVPRSLTAKFSASTTFSLSLFVGSTCPLLGMNKKYRASNSFGKKMTSNLFS